MKKIILIFIDGLGIGEKNSVRNPVLHLFSGISPRLQLEKNSFPCLFDRGAAVSLDACLGVPGIPQSATGQTSLYTGVNAQKLLGYHLSAMPNAPLIDLIMQRSLPVALKEMGLRSLNANLHTPGFFRMRRGGHRNRFPVSSVMTFAGKTSFLFEKDYRAGRGVFMDITGEYIRELGVDIPHISPEEAAMRLCHLTDEADFIYFEYFLTDRWGHKRNRASLEDCLADLVPFLTSLSRETPGRGIDLMIVSDHGNSEDFSTGDHTRNPVPFVYLPPEGTPVSLEDMPGNLTEVYEMIKNLYRV